MSGLATTASIVVILPDIAAGPMARAFMFLNKSVLIFWAFVSREKRETNKPNSINFKKIDFMGDWVCDEDSISGKML